MCPTARAGPGARLSRGPRGAGGGFDPSRHHDGHEARDDRGGRLDRAHGRPDDRLRHSRADLHRHRRGDRRLGAAPAGRRARHPARHLAVRRSRERLQAQSQHPRVQRGTGGGPAAGRVGVSRRGAAERARRGGGQLRSPAHGARPPRRAAERRGVAAGRQLARRGDQPADPPGHRPHGGRSRARRRVLRRGLGRGIARRRDRRTDRLLPGRRVRAGGRLAPGHRRGDLQRLRQPRPPRERPAASACRPSAPSRTRGRPARCPRASSTSRPRSTSPRATSRT